MYLSYLILFQIHLLIKMTSSLKPFCRRKTGRPRSKSAPAALVIERITPQGAKSNMDA